MTKEIKYALECIEEREIQITNIKNYIDWYNRNIEEIEAVWSQIEKAFEKGGFSNLVWEKESLRQLTNDILNSKKILEQSNLAFAIELTGSCKGYVGSRYDKVWDLKVKEPLQKKAEKIKALLPEGYVFGCSGFYPWSFRVENAGEVKKIRIQIYKEQK